MLLNQTIFLASHCLAYIFSINFSINFERTYIIVYCLDSLLNSQVYSISCQVWSCKDVSLLSYLQFSADHVALAFFAKIPDPHLYYVLTETGTNVHLPFSTSLTPAKLKTNKMKHYNLMWVRVCPFQSKNIRLVLHDFFSSPNFRFRVLWTFCTDDKHWLRTWSKFDLHKKCLKF